MTLGTVGLVITAIALLWHVYATDRHNRRLRRCLTASCKSGGTCCEVVCGKDGGIGVRPIEHQETDQ